MSIRTVAVLGAGTMGAAVAAHLANVGLPVLLLDIPGPVGERNAPARLGLERAKKASPAAFMLPQSASLITLGNLEDDLGKLSSVDWVFEAVLERLDVKRSLWERVEVAANPHAILSSNSSGIPMSSQAEGRSESFRQRFLGTHFFNPPRYLHLLELIPTLDTSTETLKTMREFGERVLGKGVVVANDVPGFIANRVGVFAMNQAIRAMEELELWPDVVDALTGPLIGRPKSATLRTADLTGLDVAATVAANLNEATEYDFDPPKVQARLIALGRLGEKTGEGFYKRVKRDGKSVVLTLNPSTLEYEERPKVRLAELEPIRVLPTATERLKALLRLDGVHGEFMRRTTYALLHFAAVNAPVMTADLNAVDDALRWGFGWEAGPFEILRALGVKDVLAEFEARGWDTPALLRGGSLPDAPRTKQAGLLVLKDVKADPTKVIRRAAGASLLDLGDGVALLEFHSKVNALGEDALRMTQFAMKTVPEGFAGLVIGNDGEQFSAGANLAALLFNAQEGEWDEVDRSVRLFQRTTTSLRTAPFPVVVAPFGLTLGGGAELTLYADRVQAHAELYMGLVEMGVGLIPAGGGTTELLARYSAQVLPGEDPFSAVKLAFERIALARVSSSALEARAWGYLRDADGVSFNRDRLIFDAKRAVLNLADGYMPGRLAASIPALGEAALAKLKFGVYSLVQARQASAYDAELATALAKILSGGALNYATNFPAQHFLDLEREAFLALCGKRKTQERIAHMLKTGKPLRN